MEVYVYIIYLIMNCLHDEEAQLMHISEVGFVLRFVGTLKSG